MASIGFLGAAATTAFARPVIRLLYGQQYAGSVVPLVVLGWAGIFVCLGVARETWMLGEGLTRLSFATTASGAVINIALNFVLLPRYGAIGAASATLIAQIVAVWLATLFFASTRPMFKMQSRALLLIPFREKYV